MTKVLVAGGGAREHVIAATLARDGAEVYATLKNRNPGILRLAKAHALVSETDGHAVAERAKEWGVDLAVIGMDAAIAAGVADALEAVGVPSASPTKAAGEIEWSKTFMRSLLDKHDVPGRIRYRTFDAPDGLREYVEELGSVVVKPVGLTGGKGVKVMGDHLADTREALAYAKEILDTAYGGSQVVIEENLEGEEFSLQAFCDGNVAVCMPAVQDHKRAFDGDTGPNTGGMGSYSAPGDLLPFMTEADLEAAREIVQRIVDALRAEGRAYKGVLYGQFMITKDGPKVIEVNSRFGDPEAMNVLSVLDSNYVDICKAMAGGSLTPGMVKFAPEATVCKYVVPEGYGTTPAANEPLSVDEEAIRKAGASCYYAAVNAGDDGTLTTATHPSGASPSSVTRLRTTTSRAVGLVARGATIEEANAKVDAALAHVTGPKLFHRRDIGTRALVERRVAHMNGIRGARDPVSQS